MAKRPPKQWVYSPKSAPKPKVPEATKQAVQQECDAFMETTLKPHHIKPAPENPTYSYIVELYNLWFRNFFYFCAKHLCPAPNCISEFFEVRYTRLEYTAPDTYTMAYMRHTGQWQEVYSDVSLDECLSLIRTEAFFQP